VPRRSSANPVAAILMSRRFALESEPAPTPAGRLAALRGLTRAIGAVRQPATATPPGRLPPPPQAPARPAAPRPPPRPSAGTVQEEAVTANPLAELGFGLGPAGSRSPTVTFEVEANPLADRGPAVHAPPPAEPPPEPLAQDIFRRVDADASGLISFGELARWWGRQQLATTGAMDEEALRTLKALWDEADADQSGELDVGEFGVVLARMAASGWVEARDQGTGRVYYYNKKTRETRWEAPDSGDALGELLAEQGLDVTGAAAARGAATAAGGKRGSMRGAAKRVLQKSVSLSRMADGIQGGRQEPGEGGGEEGLKIAGQEVVAAAHEACFDSWDEDQSGALDMNELASAFQQLGLNLTRNELLKLREQFDVDHDGVLSKEEFTAMVEYYKQDMGCSVFGADDWCPHDVGVCGVKCISCECLKWGRRSASMSSQEVLITGYTGLWGIPCISTSVNHSVEVIKSKWLYIAVGVSSFRRLSTYSIEFVLVALVASVAHIAWAPGTLTSGVSIPAVVLATLCLVVRLTMFLRRRRARVHLYSLGGQQAENAFPVLRHHARDVLETFLRIKGVDVHAGAQTNPVRTFTRRQCSSVCKQEEHRLTLGDNYYHLAKLPVVGQLSDPACALMRKEYMAGHLSDLSWVHTARWGKNLGRLCGYWIKCLVVSAVLALLLAVALHPECDADHNLCDDPTFAEGPVMNYGHCAPECFELSCREMHCGGRGATCLTDFDGHCDEPRQCMQTMDPHDCVNLCRHRNLTENGVCDEPSRCPLGSDRVDCSNITKLYAVLRADVRAGAERSGLVLLSARADVGRGVQISARLWNGWPDQKGQPSVSSGHKWHVHKYPVRDEHLVVIKRGTVDCSMAGGHYDPEENEARGLPWRGDLSARHGHLTLNDVQEQHVDTVLRLEELENRSIVVHVADGGAARAMCGTIRRSLCASTDDDSTTFCARLFWSCASCV
jgi:Ca2+-binding EF-hand superfamily protein